jgi:hypothetical protein
MQLQALSSTVLKTKMGATAAGQNYQYTTTDHFYPDISQVWPDLNNSARAVIRVDYRPCGDSWTGGSGYMFAYATDSGGNSNFGFNEMPTLAPSIMQYFAYIYPPYSQYARFSVARCNTPPIVYLESIDYYEAVQSLQPAKIILSWNEHKQDDAI